MPDSIFDTSATLNGKKRLIITSEDEIGKLILKAKFSKIETTTQPMQVGDQIIPIGSLMISEE